MQNKAKTLTVISALAFIMSFNALPVSANEGQDMGESVSTEQTEQIDITHTEGYVKINCENIPSEISWRIYRIGLRTDDEDDTKYEYTLDNKFSGLTADDKFTFTEKTTSREIEAFTKSLIFKITKNSVEADYTVHCAKGGIAESKLPYGLYLFVADGYADYPVLTAVKDWNEVLTVNPKFTVTTSDSSSTTDSVPVDSVPTDNGGGGGGTSGGGGYGNVTGGGGGGTSGGSGGSTGGGDTTSTTTTTEVVTETTTETTGTPTPSPSDNSPNPHTAGIVKTATGSTLLLAAAGVGSMIGRRRKKEEDD